MARDSGKPAAKRSEPAAGLVRRKDALRQAAAMPGSDAHALLDAALTELDGAIEALTAGQPGHPAASGGADGDADTARAERHLLRAAFQQAPAALLILELDGTIRRANAQAAELLGVPAGYATGKSLEVFVDPPSRAAAATQLAAAARAGTARQSRCRMLGPGGPAEVAMAVARIEVPGEPPLLGVTLMAGPAAGGPAAAAAMTAIPADWPGHAAGGGAGEHGADDLGATEHGASDKGAGEHRAGMAAKAGRARPAAPAGGARGSTASRSGEPSGGVAAKAGRAGPAVPASAGQGATAGRTGEPPVGVAAMARRMDMVTSVTRLLLDNSTFSEAVTLQRCARLLAGELATWAIVDMERGGRLRRHFAIGPRGGPGAVSAQVLAERAVRDTDPQPGTAPAQVLAARKPVLAAHADPAALGAGPDGTPLLLGLCATSLICVPVWDGATSYGTLTLLRVAGEAAFGIADLALAEILGEHLGIAIRVDRMFRRRSEVAEALQASLLPARLPDVPGLELAAAYIPATRWPEVSGDFYDVFRHAEGWAVAIGDVCGKGQDAAAMTAAARHAIRALAHAGAPQTRPEDVLAAASEVLLAGDYEERFVTAKLAFLRWRDRRWHVLLGGAGHPGPAVVRADGRVEILDGDGLPLGLFPGAQPSLGEVELDEGDLLFFYSDGVIDARSARLGFLEDRLADELAAVAGRSAAEAVRAVTDLVTEFSGGELRDDVTIVAVKATAADG
jgi:serine phosphatase RsbU (regulator of sigma subunit)/PAS domain-containing protein